MSRKKKSKKPRTMAIGIGIEAGSTVEVGWSQKAQRLSYRVKKGEKSVKPVNTTISMSYERPQPVEKVLTKLISKENRMVS